MIRPCAAPEELDTEGKTLNHCVATYKEKHADGKTAIFFLRRASEPEKPWYTLELKLDDFTVLQNRGKCNCARTAAVEALGRLSQWSGQLGLSKTGHALEQDETFAASSRETREMLIRQLEAFAFRHAIDPVRCAKALVQAAEERGDVYKRQMLPCIMEMGLRAEKRWVDWTITATETVLLAALTANLVMVGMIY